MKFSSTRGAIGILQEGKHCSTASDGRTFLRVEYWNCLARLSDRSMLYGDDPGPDGAVLGFLTKEYKMRGFVCLGLGVLLFLAWAMS
jgi:hypothetical protein